MNIANKKMRIIAMESVDVYRVGSVRILKFNTR